MATYKAVIKGTATLLHHRYPMPKEEEQFKIDCERAGLDPKKSSNVRDSLYKNESGAFIPSFHLKGAIVGAGKGEKVSGKGNMTWNNRLKIGLIVSPAEIPFSPAKSSYDFVHQAYVKVSMSRVLRERPAFSAGWQAEFIIDADSNDIPEAEIVRFVKKAGRIGIGDNRPEKSGTCGTFEMVSFQRYE